MIQVCVHDLFLVYHICHADIECGEFKKFLKGGLVKLVTVDFTNDKRFLGRIGLVVGNPFDLQKNRLLPSSGQPSMLTLTGAWLILRTVNWRNLITRFIVMHGSGIY